MSKQVKKQKKVNYKLRYESSWLGKLATGSERDFNKKLRALVKQLENKTPTFEVI